MQETLQQENGRPGFGRPALGPGWQQESFDPASEDSQFPRNQAL